MSEVQGNDEQGKPEKHLVILVHGINTFADWMPAMTETLESAGFLVAPTSFGGMSVSRFLLPFQRPRQQAIQRVLTNIRTAKEQCQPHKISVITFCRCQNLAEGGMALAPNYILRQRRPGGFSTG
jgi:hypothetical protein